MLFPLDAAFSRRQTFLQILAAALTVVTRKSKLVFGMDFVTAAVGIIRTNRYLTLATAGPSGPWASPVAFTVEPDATLIFYSAVDSVHVRNLVLDPRVSGAIFDSTKPSDSADGVQFLGEASEIKTAKLEKVMARYFQQSFPDVSVRKKWERPAADFSGEAPQRFYGIEIKNVYLPDPNSQKVDRRVEVPIDEVRRALLSKD